MTKLSVQHPDILTEKNEAYANFKDIYPVREILVLMAYANSKGSGEPALPRSLARAFAVRTYKERT